MPSPELRTSRLLLRRWRPADRAAFATMNADPEVMEHFVAPLTREESDLFADRIEAGWHRRGWGLWAVELPGAAAFLGFVGLEQPGFESHFTPAVEVGWRLAKPAWGHGYATEAATAVLDHGFQQLKLPEIVSFTATPNTRSQGVMRRLGMVHDPEDDFDHPRIDVGNRLRRHVLYRMSQARWARLSRLRPAPPKRG